MKKGFTLIELIVVIAIVCMVVLVLFGASSTTTPPPAELIATSGVPLPSSTVVDNADMLSSETEASLRAEIGKVDKSIAEVGVLTVSTLEGDTIEQFGIKVGDSWKVGDAKLDNGVILIIAKQERKSRIEVGSGAEACITDSKAGEILRESLTPEFKAGNFDAGTYNAVMNIIGVMQRCKP